MNLDYIAGFIDGEGSIGAYRWNNNVVFRLQIGNTNYQVLEDIKIYLEGIGIRCNKITTQLKKNEKHKTSYVLAITARRDLIPLLVQILDKLVIKKDKAKYIIEHCNLSSSNSSFNIEELRSIN